ncbi:MAG: putative drug exporter of the superfamily [Solirubrobacteraceae bacterium]|nr:putative drug exporter of the superfamily [Solirubrobacteraceae bacterium]
MLVSTPAGGSHPGLAWLQQVYTVVTGRRTKWIVAATWLVLALVAATASTRFHDAQDNDQASYLPGNAESSKALAAVKQISGGEELTPAVVVFHRASGLRARDRRLMTSARRTLNAKLPRDGLPAQKLVFSKDRDAALMTFGLRLHDSEQVLNDDILKIKDVVRRRTRPGLEVAVAGPAGSAYDAAQVFKTLNGTLLLVTVSLIFVLLLVIYRSPIFWLIPLLAVGVAEVCSEGLGYLLTLTGVTVNAQAAGILTVLVFGAGTDYALLLVSRYREELRRHPDHHDAMRAALGHAGPVMVASAFTVILALLCLLFAHLNGTRGLGPIAATGIALALLSALTLLPALLVIFGRRVFWPFVPGFSDEQADEVEGLWTAVAKRVDRSHRRIALITTAALSVMCVGVLSLNTGLTSGNSFRGSVESMTGQSIIAAHYPDGMSAPAHVIVPRGRRVAPVKAAVARAPGVPRGPRALGPVQRGAAGSLFTVTLAANPSSQRAFGLIESLRRTAKAAGGSGTLVGGPTAQEVDVRAAATRDTKVIAPMILVVVFVILALLLRALLAPLLLIATVLISYSAALGTGALVFKHAFGYPGEDPSLVLFTLLFLVALGVDYNIFLMARVREETLHVGTRRGVIRALAMTGPVITSAGVVLAGTFAALASLPLIGLTELGFVIAFGVLLDTFLVRTVLVPALVLELGHRVWWPSALARPVSGPLPGGGYVVIFGSGPPPTPASPPASVVGAEVVDIDATSSALEELRSEH